MGWQASLLARLGLLAGLLTAGGAGNAVSGTAGSGPPHSEIFSGGVVAGKSFFSWSGMVKSLSGNLYDQGWRLRIVGCGGYYQFASGDGSNSARPVLGEIMGGYQFRKGPLFSKIFAGFHYENHFLARPDPSNRMAGHHYGIKIISENWLNLPHSSFLKLDGSLSSIEKSYQATLAAGSSYLWPRLRLGPEIQIVGKGKYYQLRGGLSANWLLENGEISLDGGLARDWNRQGSIWAGLSWLRRY